MTRRNYNNTSTPQVLQNTIGPTDASLSVNSTTSYPDPSVHPFILTVDRGLNNQEAMLCTAKTATSFTVTRGYDGTSAQNHTGGVSIVEHTSTAIDVAEPNAFINTMNAKGDLLYQANSGDSSQAGRLPIGSQWQIMQVNNGLPSWQTVPAEVSARGSMDGAAPNYGNTTQAATISGGGAPRCNITVPGSGKVRVEWGAVVQADTFGDAICDLYLAVGWLNAAYGGVWGDNIVQPVGTRGSRTQVVCAAFLDGNGSSDYTKTLNGSVQLTALPTGSWWFYLLWTTAPGSANAMLAGGRGANQNGTYIRVVTQPWGS